MNIHIIAVGRQHKKSAESDLLKTYTARLPWSVEIVEIEAKKSRTDTERFLEENNRIRAAIPRNSFVIALDSRGKVLSSEQFAATLTKVRDEGLRTLALLIGGADGLDAATLSRADLQLSFGMMIWPHMLARVMLAEQLFRAHAIMTHHPYHRASGSAPR